MSESDIQPTEPTPDLTIDTREIRDQATVRAAIKRWPKRWRGLTPEVKEKMVEGLVQARDKASVLIATSDTPEDALTSVQAMASVVRTAVAMEGQTQADEHYEDKNERLDSGKVTDRLGLPAVVKFEFD